MDERDTGPDERSGGISQSVLGAILHSSRVKKEADVQPRLDRLQHPSPRRRRDPVRPAARPEQASTPRSSADAGLPEIATVAAAADDASPPLRDRGISLLAIFTGATLLIVALVCLVAGIDRWWILIPVMAVDLTVTGAVIAVMGRLLNDGSDT
jgi:hypothetical protein